MTIKQKTLRCDDGHEAVVFTEYTFDKDDINYEITVEDSYQGGYYKGFFGRLRRAWAMFKEKPVTYTGIYTMNKQKMRNFLEECLSVIND